MTSRRRSAMWNHFRETETGKKAKCLYCSHVLSFSAGSFGNLSRHIKAKHPTVAINRVVEQNEPPASSTSTASISNVSTSAANSPTSRMDTDAIPGTSGLTSDSAPPSESRRKNPQETRGLIQEKVTNYVKVSKPISALKWKQIDEQLTTMIVKEYQPFSVVEDEEFKKFVSMLNPHYKLPSRKTVSSSLLPQLFTKIEERVSQKLQNVTAACLTTDCWTSVNNQNFMAVTSHFINSEFKLESVLLECTEFDERHTANNLATRLQEVIRKWGLENKVAACVSDNAYNIAAAIRLCNLRHLSCFAHSLNLIVQKAIKEESVAPVISKIKSIVEYFKRSPHSLAKLHTTQEQMGLAKLKLKQDVPTRWNSTLEMLSRCFEVKDAIVSTLALLNTNLSNVNQTEWKTVEKLIEILKIFQVTTEEISSEKTVTRSKVIAFVKCINKHMLSLSLQPPSEMPPHLQSVISCIQKEMFNRFKDIEENELSAQCTVLDPRFKKLGFDDENKFNAAVEKIKAKITTFHVEDTAAVEAKETPQPTSSSSLLWGEFDSKVAKLSAREGHSRLAAGIVELDKYLQEPLLPRSQNPLQWWQDRRNVYPRLFQMAMRRLCILGKYLCITFATSTHNNVNVNFRYFCAM